MNFFKLTLFLQSFPLRQCKRVIEEGVSYSDDRLRQHQKNAKWAIVNFHKKNNPWYKAFVQGDEKVEWEQIPLLSKQNIQRPLTEIITPQYLNKSLYRNNTSGSTGIPFHFVKDKFCHAMTWALIFQKYKSIGLEYGKSLQARFFGIPLSRKKYLKEKLKDWVASRVRFPVFDLSDQTLERYLNRFYKTPFEFIYGYTSSLVLFAKYVQRREIVLKEVCPSLRCCIVTSEVCSPDDRLLLQEVFGVNIINEYGAAELDLIAFEDNDGDFVLNEENLYIEVLDEHGQPVPPGVEGEVVVTSLYNKAMPFIRYRLGDRIVLKNHKKNGRRVIESVQGRVNDVAILPSGKKSPGLTFYYVSKSMLETSGVIKEFIIKQISPNEFLYEYVATETLTQKQQQQVQKLMDQYLEPGLQATFIKVEKIERSAAGKFKHFQYLVPITSQPETGVR
jgi:phenylacetate-CoA ligase